ncbi:MAG: efflux RND transporter permease subunit [Nitrospirae bacterium]|nr:efflux RND transporter permease subunit [Nitrospirota bacterium]
MLNWLVQQSLRNRTTVLLLFAAVAAIGAYLVANLPVDAVPDITPVQVMVNTDTKALDPEQIEKTVTFPIETEMSGIARVKEARSLSKYGLSQVIINFEDGTDIYWARQQVAERLQSVRGELPGGLSPELAPITTGLGEVAMYVVLAKPGSPLASKPEKERLLHLRTLHDFVVVPYLKRSIKNVAGVDSIGGYKKEIHIEIHPERLERFGLTIEQIAERLEALGENFGGGYIQPKGRQVIVRTSGRVENLEEIRGLPIKLDVRGKPVALSEVADVREGYSQRVGGATYNGEETVLGFVLMLAGANSRQVATDAERALKVAPMPPDVELKLVYSRSYLVNATLKTVAKNLAEGAALVIAVLVILLGNLRGSVFVALAIPLSMLFGFIGMRWLGVSANLMSLGAIDFGLLVDAAIVIIENTLRRLEENNGKLDAKTVSTFRSSSPDVGLTRGLARPTSEGGDPGSRHSLQDAAIPGRRQMSRVPFASDSRMDLILDSVSEVIKPVTLGMLIIMLVYVPILALEGIEGKLFQPMAVTVLMALGASLIVAVFLMPILAYLYLRPVRAGKLKETLVFRLFRRMYRPVLDASLRHRAIALAPAVVLLVAALLVYRRMGADFMPPLDEGDFVINLTRSSDIGVDASLRMQMKSDRVIADFPEVEEVYSRVGTAEAAMDAMGVHLSDTFVILKKDLSQWPATAHGGRRTKKELYGAIKEALERATPGQEVSENQPIEMRVSEILEGSRADVTLRIYGKDLPLLTELIEKAITVLEKVPGAEAVEMDALTALRKSPVLSAHPDYTAIARYGLNIHQVNDLLEAAMAGKEVGSFYEQQWRFPIVLRVAEEKRENIETIKSLPVGIDGGSIPLRKVAGFKIKGEVTTISHDYSQRYAAVAVFLSGRDIVSFVEEAKRAVAENLNLPEGYSLSWGGQFKNLERARKRLAVIVPLILAAVFLILWRTFGTLQQALLIYTGIPLAVTGGVFALAFRGIPLSVSAAVGFIALTGIAVLNGMVLMTFFNQLRAEGADARSAAREGALIRLRPVLMTALVASLGFLPMALNTGIGAEVQRPLATVVIGGVLTSTLLTLIVLPALYAWVERESRSS